MPAETVLHESLMQDADENGRRAALSGDVIDPKIMHAVVGGDSLLIRELALEFLPGARNGIEEIGRAVENGLAECVRSASHSLKGSCALVGARHLIAICSSLEAAARAGDWQLIRELVSQLDPRMREVEIATEAFLRQIEAG